MRGNVFAWIPVIILVSLFLFQCKSKPGKPATNQPPVVKTDDSIVFRELRKIVEYQKADSFYIAYRYDSAIYFYKKALSNKNIPPKSKLCQEIYNRIGYSYVQSADYKMAKLYLDKALLFVNVKSPDLVDANTFDNIGVTFHRMYESDSALQYLQKSFKTYSRILETKICRL